MKIPPPLRQVGEYTLGKTIGRGSMGKVRIATSNNIQYGVKIVKRPLPFDSPTDTDILVEYSNFISDDLITQTEVQGAEHLDERRIIREMAITMLLDHPFIVTVHKVFVSNHYYYIIMDYVNGTHLLDFIISHGKLKEKLAQTLLTQLISAIDYCHKNNICHRDLKIENILLNNSGKVQLIDFGLCNLYNPKSYLNTFCGSLYFAAPELLSAKKYVGPEIDVWSLGVILYVLVCGCVPFDDANLPTLHAKIINGSVDYPSHLSPNLRSLLGRMLVVNPTQRATLDEISQCQWLSRSEKIGNFLPARQPIAKPIDLQVVQNMGGFNFGTKEQIIEKIENSINSGSTESQSIISVYHLVQEKLHRGAAKYKESSQIRVPSEPIKRPLPISVSLINQDSSRIPLRRTRSLENTKNIIRKKRQSFVGFRLTRTRSKQSTVEDYNSVLEKDDSLFSTWKSKVSKFTKKKDLEADAGAKREVAQDDDLAMDFKPKYNPILPQVISVKNKVASAFTSLVSEFKHRTSRSKADVGAEEKINDIVPPIGVEERFPSTMPIDVPSHGRPREGDGSVTPNSDNRLSTSLPQDDIVQPLRSRYLMPLFSRNKAHESDSEAGKQAQKFAHEELSIGQIDDFIEKVAFTRLFTVSTTSTKPVSEIRTAILFALSRLQNPNSMIVNETRGKVVVTLLDSNKRKLSVDAISKLSVSTSNLTDTGEELHTPGDPTVDAPFRSFRVVFEITICRIAIMNLRCVRFKRLSGDTWIYKAACSKILENMGL